MKQNYSLFGLTKDKDEIIYLKGNVSIIEGRELEATISEFKEAFSDIKKNTKPIRTYDLEGSIFVLHDDMKIEMMETPREDNVPHISYLVNKQSIDGIAGKYLGDFSIDVTPSSDVDLSRKITPELIREMVSQSKHIKTGTATIELKYKR